MKPWAKMVVCGMVLAMAGSTSAFAVTPGGKIKAQGVPELAGLGTMPATAADNFTGDVGFPKTGQSKVYQFNLKGKWGIRFDVNQPEMAPSGFNDVDAGAFYKLTPSLRVGGTLGFGEKTDPLKPEPSQLQNGKKQPRVRFETTFKF
ncbi:MAG: NtrZ family periplasmic regulatory protein [Asticcacaulis sp.]